MERLLVTRSSRHGRLSQLPALGIFYEYCGELIFFIIITMCSLLCVWNVCCIEALKRRQGQDIIENTSDVCVE